jgi:hypothetical protein
MKLTHCIKAKFTGKLTGLEDRYMYDSGMFDTNFNEQSVALFTKEQAEAVARAFSTDVMILIPWLV